MTPMAPDTGHERIFSENVRTCNFNRKPCRSSRKLPGGLLGGNIGDTIIVEFSDAHKALADMAAEAEGQELGGSKYVLIEAVSAVRHLSDQYGLNYEEVLTEAAELYRHQQERDLKNLESQE